MSTPTYHSRIDWPEQRYTLEQARTWLAQAERAWQPHRLYDLYARRPWYQRLALTLLGRSVPNVPGRAGAWEALDVCRTRVKDYEAVATP